MHTVEIGLGREWMLRDFGHWVFTKSSRHGRMQIQRQIPEYGKNNQSMTV